MKPSSIPIDHELARSLGRLEGRPVLDDSNGKLGMDKDVVDKGVQGKWEHQCDREVRFHVEHC